MGCLRIFAVQCHGNGFQGFLHISADHIQHQHTHIPLVTDGKRFFQRRHVALPLLVRFQMCLHTFLAENNIFQIDRLAEYRLVNQITAQKK